MNVWPEYNLEELIFKNRQSVLLKSFPRLLYNLEDQIVAVKGATTAERDRLIALSSSALRDVIYFISVFDRQGGKIIWEHRFRHPFPAGTFVDVKDGTHRENPRNLLFIQNRDCKTLFSDNFTVEDISQGAVKSSTRAFQFLER